jgi:Tol biopolymer transport system component
LRGIHRLLILVALLAVPLALADPASAKLVYRCGPNLCQSNDDGSGQKALTTDATQERSYFGPDLSADGTKLSFFTQAEPDGAFVIDLATNARTTVGTGTPSDVAISPDGNRLAVQELGGDSGPGPGLCYFNASGGGRGCEAPGNTVFGLDYTPDGRVVSVAATGASTPTGRTKLCLRVADGSGKSGCEQDLVLDPAHELNDPAVSPDGKQVVLTWNDAGNNLGPVVVYDLGTGAFVRQLTAGAQDSDPVWTADGAHVIFTRGANTDKPALYSIESAGAQGSETRIVADARDAAAGPPAAVPEPVSGAKVKSSQKGAAVKGSVVIGNDDSKLVAELKAGGKSVGKLTRKSLDAGRFPFKVKLNGAGKRALKAAGKLKVKLTVSVTPPGGKKDVVRRTVTLKG